LIFYTNPETGGINCMVIDSTALPQQAIKDIIDSAFQSAGQRCSALRLVYLQDDIYDSVLELLREAMDELQLGDPWELTTDVGPVIDAGARGRFMEYIARSNVIYLADYSLTFGLHTRIDNRVEDLTQQLRVGNIYVNRNQIGAVVGSQPFGGSGLSGTGPKAGGPEYLPRFQLAPAVNKTVENKSASLTATPASYRTGRCRRGPLPYLNG